MKNIWIKAAELPAGRSAFSVELQPDELELEYDNFEFDSVIKLDVECMRYGLEITCHAQLHTTAKTSCIRCLDAMALEVCGEFDFGIRLAAGNAHTAELWEEDIAKVDPDYGKVDIAPRIRDEVILLLPTHPLCVPECKGLCPKCGANLNHGNCEHVAPATPKIDPRWAKLAELAKTKK